jgi:anti-sigma B factor antagonist
MDVTTKDNGDTLIVKVSGAVDTSAAEILRSELNKIAGQRPKKVIMDLSMVPTMGSSGIGKILMFFKSLDSSKASFEIKGIHENLYNIFKAVKLDKLFPISMR